MCSKRENFVNLEMVEQKLDSADSRLADAKLISQQKPETFS